jgi:hypothetical protein
MITSAQIPEELFHYCPTNSFHGIISSKQLWLSNLEYSNDPDENLIAFQILDSISKNNKNDSLKNFAKEIIDSYTPGIEHPSTCVFCMSQVPDHLGQWREYADNGNGYIIGFSPQYFIEKGLWTFFDPRITSPIIDRVLLSKCIYDPEEQRSIIETLLTKYQADHFLGKKNSNPSLLKYYLKLCSSVFKHHAYSFESEWRIICFPFEPVEPEMPEISKVKYEIDFRSRREGMVRYVKQYLDKGKSPNILLSSITIGPNVFNQATDIFTFLYVNGYKNVLTSRSKLKIRDK